MIYNEEKLIKWSKPVSETEDRRCLKAIDGVVKALKHSDWRTDRSGIDYEKIIDSQQAYKTILTSPKGHQAKIIIQGSYGNNTNVRQESDVDVSVILISSFKSIYRPGLSRSDYGFVESDYGLIDLKTDLYEALKVYFNSKVEYKNKTIFIPESTSMVNSDVVPAIQKRDYREDYSNNPDNYRGGVYIYDEKNNKYISNYPEQHIESGIFKNKESKTYYKKIVRILKNIKNDMQNNNVSIPDSISSFGVESLVFNVPNYVFLNMNSHVDRLSAIIQYLNSNCNNNYLEANNIKRLFPNENTLYDYKNFISDMKEFVGL